MKNNRPKLKQDPDWNVKSQFDPNTDVINDFIDGDPMKSKVSHMKTNHKKITIDNEQIENDFYQYIQKQAEKRMESNVKDQHKSSHASSQHIQSTQIKKFDNQELNDFQQMALEFQKEDDTDRDKIESNILQSQIHEIENDRELTEEQKKVKVQMLYHKDKQERVNQIMEKHKQRTKQRKGVPLRKESKFENQMKIFKNLNTYLESKDILKKLNQLNNKDAKPKEKPHQLEIQDLYGNLKGVMEVFNNRTTKENQKEDIFQDSKQNHFVLIEKAKKILQNRNTIHRSNEESYLHLILQQIKASQFDPQSQKKDNLDDDKDLKCDQFYRRLEQDISKGKFLKVEEGQNSVMNLSKNDMQQINSYLLQRQEELNLEQQLQRQKNMQGEEEQYQAFQQKAKKILNLIVKTSKNLFNKNILEIAQTIEFQRQVHRERVKQKRINQIVTKKEEQFEQQLAVQQQLEKQQSQGKISSQKEISEEDPETREGQEQSKNDNPLSPVSIKKISSSRDFNQNNNRILKNRALTKKLTLNQTYHMQNNSELHHQTSLNDQLFLTTTPQDQTFSLPRIVKNADQQQQLQQQEPISTNSLLQRSYFSQMPSQQQLKNSFSERSIGNTFKFKKLQDVIPNPALGQENHSTVLVLDQGKQQNELQIIEENPEKKKTQLISPKSKVRNEFQEKSLSQNQLRINKFPQINIQSTQRTAQTQKQQPQYNESNANNNGQQKQTGEKKNLTQESLSLTSQTDQDRRSFYQQKQSYQKQLNEMINDITKTQENYKAEKDEFMKEIDQIEQQKHQALSLLQEQKIESIRQFDQKQFQLKGKYINSKQINLKNMRLVM